MSNRPRSVRRLIGRLLLILIAVGVIGFVLIQFIPVDQTNPPVASEPAWTSPQAEEIAVQACYDCHSNETVWPWYSQIAPASWLVVRDVRSGRRHLNFSDWDNMRGEAREGEVMAEVIYEGEMPPAYYLTMHPEARLTDAEKRELVSGLQALSSR